MRRSKVWLAVALVSVASVGQAEQPDSRELRRTPIVRVVEDVRDSIVNISATGLVQMYRRMDLFDLFFEARPRQRPVTSVGSGFVMHEAGYIVTNAHVVERAVELQVAFADGREYEATPVVVSDRYDLAILRISPDTPLKPIPMGRSDDLMIGETTVAIGNPLGYANTVTSGIISALHRKIEHSPERIYDDLIQTDAGINPGNSGGPLMNLAGELIGITTAIRSDAQNIGFAIPVNRLRELLPDMLDYAIAEKRRFDLGLRVEGMEKPAVVAVDPEGLASQAGIRVGDELVRLNDAPVSREVDFYISLLGHTAGDQVTLDLRRNGKPKKIRLTLTELPEPDGVALALTRFGMRVEELSAAAARRYGVTPGSGVLVVGVDRHSPSSYVRLQPGDLIVRIGNHPVSSLDLLGQLLQDVEPDDPADLRWWRLNPNGDIYAYEARIYAR